MIRLWRWMTAIRKTYRSVVKVSVNCVCVYLPLLFWLSRFLFCLSFFIASPSSPNYLFGSVLSSLHPIIFVPSGHFFSPCFLLLCLVAHYFFHVSVYHELTYTFPSHSLSLHGAPSAVIGIHSQTQQPASHFSPGARRNEETATYDVAIPPVKTNTTGTKPVRRLLPL
jgi:hypothetical protein